MSPVKRDRASRYVGWAAYASAACWIIGNVTVLLFYALELPASIADGTEPRIFGPLSDYASLLQFVFLLPLPLALRWLFSSRQQGLRLVVTALGVIGALIGALAQALLVMGVIEFEVNLPFVILALTLIGVWMFQASQRGRTEGFLSARLARLGMFIGACFALLIGLAFLYVVAAALDPGLASDTGAFVQRNPALIGVAILLTIPGALTYFVSMPVWLIGLGRRLLRTPLAPDQSARQPASVGAPQ